MDIYELKENIREIAKECILEMRIKSMVSEVLNESINQQRMLVEKKGKKRKKAKGDKSKSSESNNKRRLVMKMLRDEKFDHAYLAYQLWHPKDQGEKDTYRSLFSKKFTGKPDADGAVRHFTTKEINKLYSLLTTKR